MYFWLMVAVLLRASINTHCPFPSKKNVEKGKNQTKHQSCSEGVDVDLISPLPRTLLIWSSASDM